MIKLAIGLLLVAAPAFAQRGPTPSPKPPACTKAPCPAKDIDMRGLELKSAIHGLHLVFFLERADEELQRAGLERKSFIPALTKSVEDDL